MNTKPLGNFGETVAAEYLCTQGYKILERQYRCRRGEIDIIAQKDDTIVFAEVKTRRSMLYGQAALAVTRQKQEKIIRTASWYVHLNNRVNISYRFDVIEVYLFSDGSHKIQHYTNAFETNGCGGY